MTALTPGRRAYEAWRGEDLASALAPPWAALGEGDRKRWERAGRANDESDLRAENERERAPGDGELIARALLLQKAQDAIAFERERADKAEAALTELRPVRDADTARLVMAERERIRELAVKAEAVYLEFCDSKPWCAHGDHMRPFAELLADPVESEPCNQHEEAEGDA